MGERSNKTKGNRLLTLFAFIITIGVIVTIHEYGHFQVARWCGIKVLRFSIGFGKPLFKKTFGTDNTEFIIAAIPLGGYVKMLDEGELKAEREDANSEVADRVYTEAELARAFNRQSVYKRIAVVVAGPLANLLLAILIYWVLIMQGVAGIKPIVGEVNQGSVAAAAEIRAGDTIKVIDGEIVRSWSDASWALLNAAVDNKTIEVVTTNAENQTSRHRLKLEGLTKDAEVDILDKIGVTVFRPEIAPIIQKVLAGGAADQANILVGDQIMSIDGVQTDTWKEVVNIIKASPDKLLTFKVQREEGVRELVVTPAAVAENNKTIGKVGAVAKMDQSKLDELTITQHYSVVRSLSLAISKTWTTSIFSLKMMWYMVTGQASWKSISGPVTIANYAGETAGMGLQPFLSFIALVSISIGILNLLPIPVLDGGHLMYYMAEIIKGSAVTEQTMLMGQKVGFGLLGLLMTLAIFNDINRIVAG